MPGHTLISAGWSINIHNAGIPVAMPICGDELLSGRFILEDSSKRIYFRVHRKDAFGQIFAC